MSVIRDWKVKDFAKNVLSVEVMNDSIEVAVVSTTKYDVVNVRDADIKKLIEFLQEVLVNRVLQIDYEEELRK